LEWLGQIEEAGVRRRAEFSYPASEFQETCSHIHCIRIP
jgi:hypothetical protein